MTSTYQYRTPQEGVQQAMKYAEEQALANVQEDHRKAYLQLKSIIAAQGTQQLNEEQRQYFQQMDQYVEQARRQAVETLCNQDPQVAQFCREQEQRYAQSQRTLAVPGQNQIDFQSADYHNQLRLYVQEINPCNFQQLEFKLKTLYVSLINKQYSRNTALQHLRNVLQSLDQIAQQLSNTDRQREIRQIWSQVQSINQENPQLLELWDNAPIGGEDEEESLNINGQYIKSIPFTYPDNVITYMVLPVRAQLYINTKLRGGEPIPHETYIKRRKGRPSKETGAAHDYYTPVYLSGDVDQEVIEFFSQDSQQIASEIDQLAKTIYDQKDYYMKPENRQPQIQQQPVTQYGGAMGYSYGSYGMFGSRARGYHLHEDSLDDYEESDHFNSEESSEFQEEELTEEEEEQLMFSDSLERSPQLQSGVYEDDSEPLLQEESSGGQLEDIEQDEENIIDEILDIKIIAFEEAWKYPASLMVKPEPDRVWKFDPLRPKTAMTVPRSDAGFIMERMKFLEEDIDTPPEDGEAINEQMPKDQPKMYIFLVKWRGAAHIHATWELEANLSHLSSFAKVKKFKHQFVDRQTILASEKVTQQQKDNVLDQIEELRSNQAQYLIPEKIIAFRQDPQKQNTWNTSLQKVISAVKQQGTIDSDAFDGSVVKGATDNMLHYCNSDVKFGINEEGYVVKQTPGVDNFKGILYLIKWMDLSYQCCTWELHEDLANHPFIGEERLKQLRKNYKNAIKPIYSMLSNPDHCAFGQRKVFVPFTEAKPKFLVDVNSKFELRKHQIKGVNLLLSNWAKSRNMILSDPKDMGKSVTAIAYMSALYHQMMVAGPFLIIAPTDLIPLWQESLANWFPDAAVVSLIGSKEDRRYILENELIQDNIHRFTVMLTTPTTAMIEEPSLKKFKWRLMCIDEAHQLRDSKDGKKNKILTNFQTDAKLLITATPLQDSIHEFYNLLHFIDPDQFHTDEVFQKFGTMENFREALKQCEINTDNGEQLLMSAVVQSMQAIKSEDVPLTSTKMQLSDDESSDLIMGAAPAAMTATHVGQAVTHTKAETNEERVRNIFQVIRPYILRREQQMLDRQSAPKVEQVLAVNMTKMQEQYTKYILELNQTVLKYTTSEAQKLNNIIIQLKKVCNHPYMFKDALISDMTVDQLVQNSGKMQVLDALLTKFKAEGHKVLIYTQMLKTLQILTKYCELKGYKFQSLLGSNSVEARARAIGNFNKSDSQDFVFLLSTKQAKNGVNLQTATRVIVFDVDFNGSNDLMAIGRSAKMGQTHPVEIYRLVTRDSIESKIVEIAKRRMTIDQSKQTNTEWVANDLSVLRHVLEQGNKALFENKISGQQSADQIIRSGEKLVFTEMDYQRVDGSFNDFKQYAEMFWMQVYPEPAAEGYEPNDFIGQLSQQQFKLIYEGIVEYGSWRFADRVQTGMTTDDTAAAMYSVVKAAKQAASEFGADVFNLQPALNFTYQGFAENAVPALRSYFRMFLVENHVKTDRFRMPKNYFEIADFAAAWGYVQDSRLLLQAKQSGLLVSKWAEAMVEKLVCDAHITQQNTVKFLQARLDMLCSKLQQIASSVIMEKLNEDGLHTNTQFDQVNDQQLEEKESELVRRFEQSGSQFPIAKEVIRTTFAIDMQQKLFKVSLQQLVKFFNPDRKERVKALIMRFHEFASAKLHFEDFRGISALNGSPKLKNRFIAQWRKFDTSESEDNLLFKIYIQILNIVYSKMPLIINQCDEHIIALKLKTPLAEVDNDSLIQEYTKDLFDYLYRQIWQLCSVEQFPAPYIMARMCEFNAQAFDEEDFEFGPDGEDNFVLLRKERGVKNAIESEDDDGRVQEGSY